MIFFVFCSWIINEFLKDKNIDIKKIPCKIATAVNLPWCGNFYRFFANF